MLVIDSFATLGPLPGPPWGLHVIYLNNCAFLAHKQDSYKVWNKIWLIILQNGQKQLHLECLISQLLTPTGVQRGHPGTLMNNFYSLFTKISTNKTIWLYSLWKWRRRCFVLPFGSPPLEPPRGLQVPFEYSAFLTNIHDSHQVWKKSDQAFCKKNQKYNLSLNCPISQLLNPTVAQGGHWSPLELS